MFNIGSVNKGLYNRENMGMRDRRRFDSPTNFQTSDSQYEREQRRLEAKRRRRAQLSNTRRIAICGSKTERVGEQRVVKKSLDELMTSKKLLELGEKEEDKKIVNFSVGMEKAILEREEQRKLEKREDLKRMMEENKRLVKMKKIYHQERKKEDVEKAKEVEFFDKYKEYL